MPLSYRWMSQLRPCIWYSRIMPCLMTLGCWAQAMPCALQAILQQVGILHLLCILGCIPATCFPAAVMELLSHQPSQAGSEQDLSPQ